MMMTRPELAKHIREQAELACLCLEDGALTYTSTAAGLLRWSEAVSGPGGGPVQSAVAQATVTVPAATTEIAFSDGISAVVLGAVTVVRQIDGPAQIVSDGPVTIVSASGTSVMQMIDDTQAARNWSDFQQLLDLYGNDISACVMNWGTTDATSDETENRNRLDAFLFGSGPLAKDHNLTAALQSGFKFAVSPLTRHVYTGLGPTSGTRSAQVGWANDLDYPVGPPVSDMRILNDQGPHQSTTVINGAALLMHRLAVAAARALRLDTSQNPYFTTATRSGATITVGVALPNGGTLYSPLPSALRSFEVSENGGTTWVTTGFTAAISGNTVVLTRSTGTWAAGTLVRYSSNLISRTTPTSDSTLEDNIVNSALYETWAGDVVLGRGLPVLGSMVSGKWVPNWQATAA
jgi:hypothetical protein